MSPREAFEAWAKPRYFPHTNTQFLRNGTYAKKLIQAMWEAWRAGRGPRQESEDLDQAYGDGFLAGVKYARGREGEVR